MLITGEINSILTALHLITTKLRADEQTAIAAGMGAGVAGADGDVATNVQMRVVVPNQACGAVIGRNGATIKAIVDDSGAIVKASSTDATPPGITDRIITVSGELHQVMRAVCLIMQKCSEERSYHTFGNQVYTYHGQQAQVPALGMGGLGMGMGMGMGIGGMPMGMPMGGMGSTAAQLQTTMTVGVPDEVAHYMICQKVNQNVQDIAARRGPKPAGSGRGPAFAQTYNSAGSVGGES